MRCKSGLALVLAAIFLLPAMPAASQDSAAASPYAPFTARQIAPGIHLLATPPEFLGPAISNVTIVEQFDGMVVIDSGGSVAHGRAIVAFLRSITTKPVKALVFTHWHNDHPLGASEIRAAWPQARIIATAATRAGLTGPAAASVSLIWDDRHETNLLNQMSGTLYQISQLRGNPANTEAQRARYDRMAREMREFSAGYRGTILVLPNRILDRELLIDDAERPVRLMHPGRANTDGDVIAWLPRQRIVVTGDIVVAPTPFGFFSFPESWIGVLQQLKALDFATLIPGHGEPQSDAAYLDRLIATITDIRSQVGPLARQGLSLDETRQRVNFTPSLDQWGTTPRLRFTFEGFWLTPMVENAWREARGDPIIQGGGDTTPASVNRRRAR